LASSLETTFLMMKQHLCSAALIALFTLLFNPSRSR